MPENAGKHYTNDEDVPRMSVSATPVKLAFSVRADKVKDFKKINGSKKVEWIKQEAKKVTNITDSGSANGRWYYSSIREWACD